MTDRELEWVELMWRVWLLFRWLDGTGRLGSADAWRRSIENGGVASVLVRGGR